MVILRKFRHLRGGDRIMLRKRALTSLMVMTISVAFCLAAWSEPNPQQTKTQSKNGKLSAQKTNNQVNPGKDAVILQILVEAISRAIDASAEKAKTTQNPLPPDNSPFWFSLCLVFFTGILAAVAIFQFFVLRYTLRETQRVANAAIKGAEVAENAMIHGQRAYVFVKRFYRQINAALNIADICVVLENTGETPVKHMMCGFDYISFTGDIPPDFEFPDTLTPEYGIIGRKATLDIRVLMPFTVFKDTFEKKHRTYIYGWIDHNDVFPNTPRHRTEFCHEIIFPKTGSRTFNFNIYGKYNGSDDECYRKPSPYTPPA